MRLLLVRQPLRKILCWTQRGLMIGGMSLLGYAGFVLADAWLFNWRDGSWFDTQRAASKESQMLQPVRAAAGPPVAPQPGSRREPPVAELLGRIRVPRLGLSVIVVEGTGPLALRRAVGHIPGSALPGEPGNVAISGHRDTHFRPLRDIQRDDLIQVETLHGDFRYRVVSTVIVSPDHVVVLAPGEGENLTLVTCYPFNFAGAAPDRFIVQAKRVP